MSSGHRVHRFTGGYENPFGPQRLPMCNRLHRLSARPQLGPRRPTRNGFDDYGVVVSMTARLDLFPTIAFRVVNDVVRPFTKRGIGAPPVVGIGTVTVATTGRRSGRAREVPLAAARVGDTVVVSTVRRNSDWVRNLETDPTTTIWLDGCARQAEASVQRLPGLTVATLHVDRQPA